MVFTDEDLEEFVRRVKNGNCCSISNDDFFGLISRLEAAELKDCNQYHCGHETCNVWRKSAGKI